MNDVIALECRQSCQETDLLTHDGPPLVNLANSDGLSDSVKPVHAKRHGRVNASEFLGVFR